MKPMRLAVRHMLADLPQWGRNTNPLPGSFLTLSDPHRAQVPLHSTSLAETVKGCDLSPSIHSIQLSFWGPPVRRGIIAGHCLGGILQFIKLITSVAAIATWIRQLAPTDIQWLTQGHTTSSLLGEGKSWVPAPCLSHHYHKSERCVLVYFSICLSEPLTGSDFFLRGRNWQW